MAFAYFEPAPQLQGLIGSYYHFETPIAFSDRLRAEMPNLRILLSGQTIIHDDTPQLYTAGDMVLFGPRFHSIGLDFTPGSSVFGLSITPEGWQQFFGIPMHEVTNQRLLLDDVLSHCYSREAERVRECHDPASMVKILDALFTRILIERRQQGDQNFMKLASHWVTCADRSGIDQLVEQSDRSTRQVERMCRDYLGAPPKKLQRKYRALIACNRMAWDNQADWRGVAGEGYCDQAHFIREFSTFIGCTPGAFAKGAQPLLLHTILSRRTIRHASALSLIA